MMDRRRALMMVTSGVTGTKIKDIPVGSEFRMAEGGYAYIFLGIINNTAWVLRKNVITGTAIMRNDGVMDYEGSSIDTYLTTTWYNTFSDSQKAIMQETSQTLNFYNGSALASKTIQRKIFIPSYPQLYSDTNGILSALKTYYNTTNESTARAATYRYWTCSARSSSSMYGVNTNGAVQYPSLTEANYYRRPVVSINKDTPVALVNGYYIPA